MIISNYFYCVKWAFAKVLPKLMLQLDAKPPTDFKPNVLCSKTGVFTCKDNIYLWLLVNPYFADIILLYCTNTVINCMCVE